MKNFVDYKWLKSNINKDNLIILDVRKGDDTRDGISIYKEGHIKGAQYVPEDIMVAEVSTHGGRSPLPKIETFVEDMKNLGMDDDSTVVIYDNENLTMSGRLWWMLKYIGKENVFVLDGGFEKWKDNNGEITTTIPTVEKSDSLSVNINDGIKVDMEYVKKAIDIDTTAIVDTRARERYSGEVEPLDRIAGHIKNALNYPWAELIKNGQMISLEEAKEHFKDLEDYEEVIVHCGSGLSALVNILLMDEIGLNPKHYSGGYSDWISYEDNEVVGK